MMAAMKIRHHDFRSVQVRADQPGSVGAGRRYPFTSATQ